MKKFYWFLFILLLNAPLTVFANSCPRASQFTCHPGPSDSLWLCETGTGWFIWSKPGIKVSTFKFVEIFGEIAGGLICYYQMSDNSDGPAPYDPFGIVKPNSKNWLSCFGTALCCSAKDPSQCQFEKY